MKRYVPDILWLLLILLLVLLAVRPSCGGEIEVWEFRADWCQACKPMAPVVADLVAKGWRIRSIDVDQDRPLVAKHKINGLPTYLGLLDGREIGRIEGATTWAKILELFKAKPVAAAVVPEPAVVQVINELPHVVSPKFPKGFNNVGAGFIVHSQDGFASIVTCGHLFTEGTGDVWVTTHDGRRWRAIPEHMDPAGDLALLRIADPGIAPLAVAETDPAPGEQVVGYGWGGKPAPGEVLPYDAANPWLFASGAQREGDSGAPLLNARRQVVACIWGRTKEGQRYGCRPGPIRQMLRAVLGVQLVPIPKPTRPPPPASRPAAAMPATILPAAPIPAPKPPIATSAPVIAPGLPMESEPRQPSQPAPAGTAAPAGPTQSGAAVPPAPSVAPAAPAQGIGNLGDVAEQLALPPAPPAPTQPQTPPPTSTGANPEGKAPSLGSAVASAAAPVIGAAASGLLAQWVPALAGGALAGGPLGLIAIWLARRGARRIIQTVTRERPVIVPGSERTETVYVGVPGTDPWAEARLQAERLMAKSDPQAARFFTYRDQLARPQMAPTNN